MPSTTPKYSSHQLNQTIAKTDEFIPFNSASLPYFYTYLLVILFFSSVFNACILWALVKRRGYNTSEHRAGKRHTSIGKRLLYNMCASSLFHSAAVISFVIFNIFTMTNGAEHKVKNIPALMCNLAGLAFVLPLTVTWLSEALVARDRYMAIVQTMKYCEQIGLGATTSAKAKKYIFGTWIISLALIFVPAFLTQTFFHYDPHRALCIFETSPTPSDTNNLNAAHLLAFVGCYVVSLMVMLRYYWPVLREASRRRNMPPVAFNSAQEINQAENVPHRSSSPSSSSTATATLELSQQQQSKSRSRLNAPLARLHQQLSRVSSSSSLTSGISSRISAKTVPRSQQYLVTYRNRWKSFLTLTIIVATNVLTAVPLLVSLILEYFVWRKDTANEHARLVQWLTYAVFAKNMFTPLVYGLMNRSVRRDLMRAWQKSVRQRQAAQQQVVARNGNGTLPVRRLSIGSHLLDFVPFVQNNNSNRPPKPAKLCSASYYDGSISFIAGTEASGGSSSASIDNIAAHEQERVVVPPPPPTRRRSLDDDGCPPSSSSSLFFLKDAKPKSAGSCVTSENLLRRLERGRTQPKLSRRRASDQSSRAEFQAMYGGNNTNNGKSVNETAENANEVLSTHRRGSSNSADAIGGLSSSTNSTGGTTPSASLFSLFRLSHLGWRRRVSAPSCLQPTAASNNVGLQVTATEIGLDTGSDDKTEIDPKMSNSLNSKSR